MSEFYHKLYWWFFWIIFFLLTPITATFSPRSQELFWLFIVQPAVAALIAWVCVRALINLSEINKEWRKNREDERRRSRARAEAEAYRLKEEASRPERHRAAQQQLASQLDSLITQSAASARELPSLIAEAEKSLDIADYEFGEHTFVPFWDAVETATKKLAKVEATVQRLIQNSYSFEEGARELDTPAPSFQVGLDTLPDISGTVARLRAVVRRAQQDPDFTKIYLMCRNNELLVAGFSTFGQALSEIGDRLDSSFDRLASSINVSISGLASEITSSQKQMTATLAGKIDRSTEQGASDANAGRKLTRTEVEMLDNIQRRRKPPSPGFRDGEY